MRALASSFLSSKDKLAISPWTGSCEGPAILAIVLWFDEVDVAFGERIGRKKRGEDKRRREG